MNEKTVIELNPKPVWPGLMTSCSLHVLAMALMLCDHLWGTFMGNVRLLNDLGRIAYPIFAFMLAEGFRHTSNPKKYLMRLLLWGLVSEIPFNLMTNGVWFYPFHQNVMWTFAIALILMMAMDKIRSKGKLWLSILGCAALTFAGFLLGFATFVDYFGFGVLAVFVFYFFDKKTWWCLLGQIVCLYYIFCEGLGGLCINVELFGHTFEIVQEGLALLALIPIWLYNGRQGYHEKWFKYFCYGFYPGHIAVLYLIARVM